MDIRGISVIMPCFLGEYPGSRKDPVPKFHRAVQSFIEQDYPKDKCELIIISDGCKITLNEYKKYRSELNISLIVKEERSKGYPGVARQLGIDSSKHEIITYLDSDDYFLDNRLIMVNKILDSNFVLDSKEMIKYHDGIKTRDVHYASATWQISHLKSVCEYVKWEDSTKGEDLRFINKLRERYVNAPRWSGHIEPYKTYQRRVLKGMLKEIGGYVICHTNKNSHKKRTDI